MGAFKIMLEADPGYPFVASGYGDICPDCGGAKFRFMRGHRLVRGWKEIICVGCNARWMHPCGPVQDPIPEFTPTAEGANRGDS